MTQKTVEKEKVTDSERNGQRNYYLIHYWWKYEQNYEKTLILSENQKWWIWCFVKMIFEGSRGVSVKSSKWYILCKPCIFKRWWKNIINESNTNFFFPFLSESVIFSFSTGVFCDVKEHYGGELNEQLLVKLFRSLDVDRSGEIGPDEFEAFKGSLDLFKKYDADVSGHINPSKFVPLMKSFYPDFTHSYIECMYAIKNWKNGLNFCLFLQTTLFLCLSKSSLQNLVIFCPGSQNMGVPAWRQVTLTHPLIISSFLLYFRIVYSGMKSLKWGRNKH